MELSHKPSIGRILDDGLALYRSHWREFYIWALLIGIVAIGFPILQNMVMNRPTEVSSTLKLISFVLALSLIIVLTWLYLCLFYKIESVIREKPLSYYEILVYSLQRIPHAIVASIFYLIALSLCFLPLILLFLNQSTAFILILALAVSGLFFWTSMSLSFFPIAIVSDHLGPLAALTQSWLLMRDVKKWLRATIVLWMGAVIFVVLQFLPMIGVSFIFGLIQKIFGQSFEMQLLQNPFVYFSWGVAGFLVLIQAALNAIFLPMASTIYIKQYHQLKQTN